METKPKARGSWGVRFFIAVLGVTLGVLFFWLLNFIETDIGTVEGPDWNAFRRQYVAAELDEQQTALSQEIVALEREIQTQSELQRLLKSSADSLQDTMDQLLSIQRQAVEKELDLTAKSLQTLQASLAAFLESHQRYQQYILEITDLTRQRQEKEAALAAVTETIAAQEKQAQEDFNRVYDRHRVKVAALKLTFLVPVFLAVSFVFMKYRTTAWWPLVWAVFVAAFIKLALAAQNIFPRDYFKYIALLVVIAIVIRILVYLIRLIVAPKKDLLIKQYQQFYDRHLCPVCTKPIKTGPLRYADWKKKATVMTAAGSELDKQEPYTCPSCGTGLYDKCGQCGRIRHTLLPYCEHCGTQKSE